MISNYDEIIEVFIIYGKIKIFNAFLNRSLLEIHSTYILISPNITWNRKSYNKSSNSHGKNTREQL